jgi:hypothetical protein
MGVAGSPGSTGSLDLKKKEGERPDLEKRTFE